MREILLTSSVLILALPPWRSGKNRISKDKMQQVAGTFVPATCLSRRIVLGVSFREECI